MTIISRLSFATIIALGLIAAASPSYATTTSQAIKLCQQNPQCHSRVGEHSVIMTIGGKDVVECPKLSSGECIIVRLGPARENASSESLAQGMVAN